MEKKNLFLLIFAFTISFIFAVILILFYTGITEPAELKRMDCSATYGKYTFPNDLCQIILSGYCPTTEFNELKAKVEVARCLCEKYQVSPNADLEKNIKDLCTETGFCYSYMKSRFPDQSENVSVICENKERSLIQPEIR